MSSLAEIAFLFLPKRDEKTEDFSDCEYTLSYRLYFGKSGEVC